MTVFSGCAPELHERLLISAIGVDLDDTGWRVTVRAFTLNQADEKEKSYSDSGITVASALEGIIKQTGKLPLYSHSSVLVFGRQCAENGLEACLDFFIRHYDSRPDMNILLSDTTAEDILKIDDGQAAVSTSDIATLLNGEKYGAQFQSADLISLINGIFGANRTASVPIIQKDPLMHITGSGLLRDFVLVDELDAEALRGMLLISGSSITDETVLHTLSGGNVSVTSEYVSSSIRFTGTSDLPRFEITVQTNGKISSMERGLHPISSEAFTEIESLYANDALRSITHYLQTVVLAKGLDAAGFGTVLLHDAPEVWKPAVQNPTAFLKNAEYSVAVTANIDRTEEEDTPYF